MKVARGLTSTPPLPPYKADIAAKTSISMGKISISQPRLRPCEPVWKVFLDDIPRRVRPFGAEGGLTRIGWGWVGGWVGARPECDSQLKAGLLLAARKRGGKTGPSGVQGPPGHSEPH